MINNSQAKEFDDFVVLFEFILKLSSCYKTQKWSFVLKHVRYESCINLKSGIVFNENFCNCTDYPFQIK